MAKAKYNVDLGRKKVANYKAIMKRGMNGRVAADRMKQIKGKGSMGIKGTV